MTTHPDHIDPDLARRQCTPDELEIVYARNLGLAWTQIAAMTGRTRGVVRRIHGHANRKVNGGYVPVKRTAAEDRMIAMTDPDILAGLRGLPTEGLSRPGAGIVPGRPTRSGKVGS